MIYVVTVSCDNWKKPIPVAAYLAEADAKATADAIYRYRGPCMWCAVTPVAVDLMPREAFAAHGGDREAKVVHGLAIGGVSLPLANQNGYVVGETASEALEGHYTKLAERKKAEEALS